MQSRTGALILLMSALCVPALGGGSGTSAAKAMTFSVRARTGLAEPTATPVPAPPCDVKPTFTRGKGKLLTRIGLGQPSYGLVVSQATRHIFVSLAQANCPGTVLMLDGKTGAILRRIRIPGVPVRSLVDDADNRLYVSVYVFREVPVSNSIVSIDTRSGRVVATVRISDLLDTLLLDRSANRLFVSSYPRDCSDTCPATVHAVDIRTERLTPFAASLPSRPQLVLEEPDQHLFAFDSTHLTILDARTGHVVQKRDVQHCGGGNVMAVNLTRRVFASVGSVPDGGAIGPIGKDGYFCIFDATGRVLRNDDIGAGVGEGLLAVDERRGYVVTGIYSTSFMSPPSGGILAIVSATDGHLIKMVEDVPDAIQAVIDPASGGIVVLSQSESGSLSIDEVNPRGWTVRSIATVSEGIEETYWLTLAVVQKAHRIVLGDMNKGVLRIFCSTVRC